MFIIPMSASVYVLGWGWVEVFGGRESGSNCMWANELWCLLDGPYHRIQNHFSRLPRWYTCRQTSPRDDSTRISGVSYKIHPKRQCNYYFCGFLIKSQGRMGDRLPDLARGRVSDERRVPRKLHIGHELCGISLVILCFNTIVHCIDMTTKMLQALAIREWNLSQAYTLVSAHPCTVHGNGNLPRNGNFIKLSCRIMSVYWFWRARPRVMLLDEAIYLHGFRRSFRLSPAN